jgi:hypothetical protein
LNEIPTSAFNRYFRANQSQLCYKQRTAPMTVSASMIALGGGLLFLLTLIFVFSLSGNLKHNDPRAFGKPLTGALPAAHKLAALATVIAVAATIRNLHRGMKFGGSEIQPNCGFSRVT